jgi:deoxyribodipyrimidine photolyase-related protein
MSDHCRHCRFDPKASTGETACPFTTLYWDFLARHRERYAGNQRMRNQYSNLDRKDPGELRLIRVQAEGLKARLTAEAFLD